MTSTSIKAEEEVAKTICRHMGDDWLREGPKGLMEAYGPCAREIIALLSAREGELVGMTDVFERPFDGDDDPRLLAARVITRAEAEAILEHRGDLVTALSAAPDVGVPTGEGEGKVSRSQPGYDGESAASAAAQPSGGGAAA